MILADIVIGPGLNVVLLNAVFPNMCGYCRMGPEPDELDPAGVEDFAVYRSPGTLPKLGGTEVRLGAIVIRGTQSDSPSSRDIPAGSSTRASLSRDSDTRVDRQLSSTSKANRFDFGDCGSGI